MSNDSLSQNEIDLLFSSGGEPEAVPRGADPSNEVQVYDFRRPHRISKDRKRSLVAMYGLLAKSLEGWLNGRVRDQIELHLQSVEQLTFGEFMLALPSPCASYIVDVTGSGQQGVIDMGHEFAYFNVDRLLGGSGKPVMPQRSLTPIERELVRVVADRVAFQLTDAWRDYVSLQLKVGGFESIPEMLQVANREDPVLVANIHVNMGEVSSLLLLCLPFAALEKFFTGAENRRQQQSQGSPEEVATDRTRLEGSVRGAKLVLGARLPTFSLPIGDLKSMKVGGVLNTGLPLNSKLHVYVSDQKRFKATPGRSGNRMAVRIEELLEPQPEHVIDPERERI